MEKFKLGFMQGRLVNTEKKGRIQYFPAKNWKKEIQIAHKIGLDCMEWTIDYDNIKKNPIYIKGKSPVLNPALKRHLWITVKNDTAFYHSKKSLATISASNHVILKAA